MIYSRSAEYAVRASLHLGLLEEGKCAMAKDIAEAEGIPAHFLAKLLQQLARKGVLKSQKGPTGGFCLKLSAKDVRLIDIVEAVDGVEHYARCIAGFPECNERMGCPMHASWIALHARIMTYLTRNTVGSLVKQVHGRVRLVDLNAARKPKVARSLRRLGLKQGTESPKAIRPSV